MYSSGEAAGKKYKIWLTLFALILAVMDWACKVYPYERVGQVSLRPGNWKWCGTCGRKWFDSIPLTSLTSRTHTLDKLVQTRNPVLFTGSEDGHVELVSL